MSVIRTINVSIGNRSYPIVIGNGLLNGGFDLTDFVSGSDCLIVSNDIVAPLYRDRLLPNLSARAISTIDLPVGESHKTMATMRTVLDQLVSTGANRDTTVIALGGGVVGDIAGFAAACYMRGVSFIQVPTTLLAQVDSSVGGKTGVNHPQGKNLIGAFHQPGVVMIDIDTLDTLPDREFRAGLAEVIKYGAICDIDFFVWLEENMPALLERDAKALVYAIARSCELKAEIVADDERELGRRAILNFGHTFAHAIENCQGYGEWLHGEAVAAGMVLAARLSDIDKAENERLQSLIAAAGLPLKAPAIAVDDWLRAMELDKKVQDKQLRFVLLRTLGDSMLASSHDAKKLRRILAGISG